jgi:hypothetical protein
MKKVVTCLGCGHPTRLYGSFKVKLNERNKSILGEVKETEVTGYLCRKCAAEAGYKVKGINSFPVKNKK